MQPKKCVPMTIAQLWYKPIHIESTSVTIISLYDNFSILVSDIVFAENDAYQKCNSLSASVQ